MRPVIIASSLAIAVSACATPPPADLALMDRMVWTGEGFAPRDLFLRDGRTTDDAVASEGTVIYSGAGRYLFAEQRAG